MGCAEPDSERKTRKEKTMTAKQYLSRVHALRRQIEALEDQVEYLTTKAAGVKGITYDADKVETSPDNVLESAMIEAAEAKNQLNERILEYSRTVLLIESQISALDNADYVELLTLRYITTDRHGKRLTLERIARMMHRSPERIWHMHGEALAEFEKVYPMEEER